MTNRRLHKKTKKNRSAIKRKQVKGGLKQKNAALTSWQAVYKMITNPHASLIKIAYSSLKGFIFRLDVPPVPENSEFFGLNAAGSDFTVPIYSLIFKFAIIGDGDDDLELPNLVIPGDKNDEGKLLPKGREKETENLESFKIEADIQQKIYTKTLSPSGKPICLAAVDFSTFDKPASEHLLRVLLTKATSNDTATRMLKYLIANVTPGRTLGLMTMELANPDFRELSSVENAVAYNSDCNYALAQIFILFAKLKTMNYDCHAGNVLASRSPPTAGRVEARTVLIDFGRTLNFTKRQPFPSDSGEIIEKYNVLTGSRFQTDLAEIMQYDITDLYVSARTPVDVVIDRMQKIIKFMTYVDYATNTTYFNMTADIGFDRPQLITFLKYIYGEGISSGWIASGPTTVRAELVLNPQARGVYERIITIIRELTEAPLGAANRVSSMAIEGMMAQGRLFSVKPRVSYDRSNVASWSLAVQIAAPGYTTRSSAPAVEEPVVSRITRARTGHFSGGKTQKRRSKKMHRKHY